MKIESLIKILTLEIENSAEKTKKEQDKGVGDKVEISQESKVLSKMKEILKEEEKIDEKKINEIKEKIEKKEYNVDVRSIVEKLIEDML
ncbi:MAG: flagellar biosynthesis anti-sigma factor FlgM [bacterium]|nr:flagellar biosynthesis anti-sigma factor FlgM [bacterium]MDW8163613.1 flagellar biosynthesis anti-sigma factor FlgM [Candidatus Omnitrophota bacterium]